MATEFTEISLVSEEYPVVSLTLTIPPIEPSEPSYETEAPMGWQTHPEYTICSCGATVKDCVCPPTPLGSITAPPYVTRLYEFPHAPYADFTAEFGSVALTHGDMTRVAVSSFQSLQAALQLEAAGRIGVSCHKCKFPVDNCHCAFIDSLCTDCILPMEACVCNMICNICGVHPQDCECPEEVPCEKCLSPLGSCQCQILVEKYGHCADCICPKETCACIFPLCEDCRYSRPYCTCRPACKGCKFHPNYCECPCTCENGHDDSDDTEEEHAHQQYHEERFDRYGW